jgi:short-subunit dehydrogenase
MNQSLKTIDKKQFGPWALVTGASSGIGKEFSRQLAANGLNVVLVARRLELLKDLGQDLERKFGIQYRAVQVDLSDENFLGTIKEATKDLDIGLVVSNAGTGNPGSFLKKKRDDLLTDVKLSVTAHLELCHYFAPVLVKRERGGILLLGAMGASQGVPFMANSGAAKAYIYSLGQALHFELKDHGVHVTVLTPGFIDTDVLPKLLEDPSALPLKPMSAEECVTEGLKALRANRAEYIPGLVNRMMNRFVPTSIAQKMEAKMLRKDSAENGMAAS